MSDYKNYYELLNVESNANLEQIKTSYKKLLLQYHPDKNSNVDTNSTEDTHNNCDKLIQLNEAWNILKNTQTRKIYDAELLLSTFDNDGNIFERLNLNQMKENCTDNVKVYTYDCRCGGKYIVDDEQLSSYEKDDEIIIECNECSLIIEVSV